MIEKSGILSLICAGNKNYTSVVLIHFEISFFSSRGGCNFSSIFLLFCLYTTLQNRRNMFLNILAFHTLEGISSILSAFWFLICFSTASSSSSGNCQSWDSINYFFQNINQWFEKDLYVESWNILFTCDVFLLCWQFFSFSWIVLLPLTSFTIWHRHCFCLTSKKHLFVFIWPWMYSKYSFCYSLVLSGRLRFLWTGICWRSLI